MEQPRELSRDEVQKKFLDYVRNCIDWWEHETRVTSIHDKLEGLAFSIMVALDGESTLPGFIVAPRPHQEDKAYNISNEENWYPENHHLDELIRADIGGNLHEQLLVATEK